MSCYYYTDFQDNYPDFIITSYQMVLLLSALNQTLESMLQDGNITHFMTHFEFEASLLVMISSMAFEFLMSSYQ